MEKWNVEIWTRVWDLVQISRGLLPKEPPPWEEVGKEKNTFLIFCLKNEEGIAFRAGRDEYGWWTECYAGGWQKAVPGPVDSEGPETILQKARLEGAPLWVLIRA